jgi:Zn-dependent peptidase ImmA (M78 family)
VKILHTDVRIEYINDPNADFQGHYSDYPRPTIVINTAYSLHTQARTKVHEYIHALLPQVLDIGEDAYTEEEVARLFELAIMDLIRNNWSLLTDLKGE